MEGRAFVKCCLSGDTVILRGKAVNGPPVERQLSFNNVSAPRLNNKDPASEEPFSFQAREYLRKLIAGKEVQFKVDYKTNTGREFGFLSLNPKAAVDGETNVTKLLVKQGLVRVKQPDGKRSVSAELGQLLELEEKAKAEQKGVWGEEPPPRTILTVDEDQRVLINKHKDKKLPAIIEQVRDASSFKICLLVGENQYQYINFIISGIKSPVCRKDIPNMPDVIEPYSEEGKFFVETRLLQQNVAVVLEGSSGNSFVGTLLHPNGNIAELLLAEGFAKIVDWNIGVVTGGPEKLRAAEAKAKAKKIRLWKNFTKPSNLVSNTGSAREREFDGTVTKILNTDMILCDCNGVERKICFASTRAPKGKEPKEIYYNLEGREYLRSRLIGKKVHVVVDYIKPASEQYEESDYGTVTLNGNNIAEALIARGLAMALRHRQDDHNRSSAYDNLLVAEDKALKAQKGLHSDKEPAPVRIIDASENAAKAKGHLPYLVRSGDLNAVVDYCVSGSRFKVTIPSQICKLTLVLGGISCPRATRSPTDKVEPFGNEALEWVNKWVLQRDVTINVASNDKAGGFIGSIVVQKDGKKINVATALLEMGYAKVHGYSADESPFRAQLYAAEASAQKDRKGLWQHADPDAWKMEEAKNNQSLKDQKLPDSKEVVVSEIAHGGKLSIQIVSPELYKLETLMANLSVHNKNNSSNLAYHPKNGEFVTGKFSVDNVWYRARVKKVNSDKTYVLTYVDFGNSETVDASKIRPLESSFGMNVLPPQSTEAILAFTTIPDIDQDNGEEAYDHLRSLTVNKKLFANVLGKDKTSGLTSILLSDPEDGSCQTVQERMIRDGWATVSKATRARFSSESSAKKMTPAEIAIQMKLNAGSSINGASKNQFEVVSRMLEAQEYAKKARLNLWRYGDFEGDDEL